MSGSAANPMMFPLLRASQSVWVLAGFALGCASGGVKREPIDGTTVTQEDLQRNPSDPIEKILEAKVPGLQVTRTADGGLALQIRGVSSFLGSNQPLYVLDGIAVQPGPQGAIAGLNPNDIESIRVLKNPEDTGIYGVRGANGVIVITTKRPGKFR